jgi:hypothetical protein
MAGTPTNLKQLLEQLEKADLAKLAETLKGVAGSANSANQAAAAFLKNLQAGIGEQKALADALKTAYGGLIDDENRASEAAKTRLNALTLIKNSTNQQKTANIELIKTIQALQKHQESLLVTGKRNTEEGKKRLAIGNQEIETAKKLQVASAGVGTALTGAVGGILAPAAKGLDAIVKSDIGRTAVSFGAVFAANKIPAVKKFFGTVLSAAKTLYVELNKVTTGFAKFTGGVIRGDNATKNLSGRLINMQKRSRTLGATVKNLSESMLSMVKSSRTFGMLMGTNRKQNTKLVDGLTEMSFRFSKVGLGAENFGKALDVIGKTYRRSDIIKQGKLLGAELVNIGRVTGQSADTIANNFGTAMEHLAAYSLPKAREEFKKLSAISAVTGVEMSKVMSVASRFDDIEGAASAVGDLNAMMGGPYLNTLDLVNATESERIEMLKSMMTQSGETFNQMDRFKQKAIATALGTDVQAASRMFSGTQTEIDSATKSIGTQGASYHQLSKAAKGASTSISEQFEASKESGLLINKAFKATESLMKNVNTQILKMGDIFKNTMGSVVVGTLNTANTKVNTLKKQFATFDGTLKGTFGLIKNIAGELVTLGLLGKKGFGLQLGIKEYIKQSQGEGPSSVVGTPDDRAPGMGSLPSAPQQSLVKMQSHANAPQQSLAKMQSHIAAAASQNNTALVKTTAEFTAALQKINDKKIEVNLNLDGQKLATYITGINAEA